MAISNTDTNLLQTLPLLTLITLSLMLLMKGVNSSDSLSFTFNHFEPNQQDLIFQGDAHVVPTTGILRVTKTNNPGQPKKNSVGRALYSTPLRLWDRDPDRVASFETSFSFVITYNTKNSIGHGIALFIAPVDTTIPIGSSGGYLGLFTPDAAFEPCKNHIVAVEFDTYVNDLWDPNYRHIGIDVNSINSSLVTKWDSKTRQVVNASISYDANTKKLSVCSSYPEIPNSETYSVPSYDIDLKTVLPEWVRVGISASTGQEVAIHDILSWSFTSNLQNIEAEKEDMNIAHTE